MNICYNPWCNIITTIWVNKFYIKSSCGSFNYIQAEGVRQKEREKEREGERVRKKERERAKKVQLTEQKTNRERQRQRDRMIKG